MTDADRLQRLLDQATRFERMSMQSSAIARLSESARALEQIGEFADTARRLAEGAVRASEIARAGIPHSLHEASLEAAEKYRALMQAMDADGALRRRASALGAIGREIEHRFTIPQFPDVAKLAEVEARRHLGIASLPVGYDSAEHFIRDRMASMRSPWLDTEEAARSAAAFVEMQRLGAAVNNLPPYSEEASAIVRANIGDWRGLAELPAPEVLADASTGTQFYIEHGFNTDLTTFPREAFDEGLTLAGFTSLSKLRSEFPVAKDEEWIVRNNNAHFLMSLLEYRVRKFIVKKMENLNTAWIKQRINGCMKKRWEKRRDEDPSHQESNYPLIAYADFGDMWLIMEPNNNWNDVFGAVFPDKEDAKISFRRLSGIRIPTMHTRMITRIEETTLLCEFPRVMNAIRADGEE